MAWSHPNYEVLGELSRGGMGIVMRARHRGSGADVAIKVLQDYDAELRLVERFGREVEILSRLSHPNVVRVLDSGEVRGQPFLAMEFVAGQNLSDTVQDSLRVRGHVPDLAWSIARFVELGEALIHCHDRGIAHRDVKPSNVLIDQTDGRAVLADFGLVKGTGVELARLSRTGEVIGTPGYMAPEQLDSTAGYGKPGVHSDVWGFGATLFYCLTGEGPYVGESTLNIYKRMLTHDPPRARSRAPKLEPWLDELCADCLQRPSSQRPRMHEVVARLRRGASRRQTSQRLAKAVWVLGPLLLAAGIVAAGAAWWANRDVQPPQIVLDPLPERRLEAEVEVQGTLDEDGCAVWVAEARLAVTGRRFAGVVPLEVGVNTLLVQVVDAAGNTATASAQVERVQVLRVAAGGGADHSTVGEAVRAARPGAHVRVAPGVYEEVLEVGGDVRIEAEDPGTAVVRSTSDASCLVVAEGAPVFVGLSFEGTGAGVAVNVQGGTPRFENCTVSARLGSGLEASGAETHAALHQCRIVDVATDGVSLRTGSKVELRGCQVEAKAVGLLILKRSEATVVETTIQGCRPGVFAREGARGTFERSRVLDSTGDSSEEAGIHVQGAHLRLVDVEVGGGKRNGLFVEQKGEIDAERLHVHHTGLAGLHLYSGARVRVRWLRIHDQKRGNGLVTHDEGTLAELEDVDISGCHMALAAVRSSTLRATRGRLYENRATGLYTEGGSEVQLVDAVVMKNEGNGIAGYGAKIRIERCTIVEGKSSGVVVGSKARLDMIDTGLRSNAKDGLIAEDKPGKASPTVLQVRGTHIEANGGYGLRASPSVEGELRDCRLRDNKEGSLARPPGRYLRLVETPLR